MKVVDVNILLYAVNEDDDRHQKILAWWEKALSDHEPIGLAWHVLHGYLRLATHPRVFRLPQSTSEAVAQVERWLNQANTRLVTETNDHWHVLSQLVIESSVVGKLMTNAHLAALAISRGATLASCDADFSRFQRLRWEDPTK